MAYFKDDQEVYQYIGKLFEDLANDDELAPKFRKANTIVQYQYRDPESRITVKLIEGEDGQVDCGETTLEPEVVMTMDADTAHKFWLGKVNVTVTTVEDKVVESAETFTIDLGGHTGELVAGSPSLKPTGSHRHPTGRRRSSLAYSRALSLRPSLCPWPHHPRARGSGPSQGGATEAGLAREVTGRENRLHDSPPSSVGRAVRGPSTRAAHSSASRMK